MLRIGMLLLLGQVAWAETVEISVVDKSGKNDQSMVVLLPLAEENGKACGKLKTSRDGAEYDFDVCSARTSEGQFLLRFDINRKRRKESQVFRTAVRMAPDAQLQIGRVANPDGSATDVFARLKS
jgi:hypothetical protein